jgi:hypothetical protein
VQSSGKGDKIIKLSSDEETREHPRYLVKLPIDLWQTADVVLAGVVTDMSEAGLGFRSIHAIQTSTDLGIRVYLSKGEFHFDSIEGTGRIIWRTAHEEEGWKGYRYGMYIVKMAPYSRDRLLKYIKMLEEEGKDVDENIQKPRNELETLKPTKTISKRDK